MKGYKPELHDSETQILDVILSLDADVVGLQETSVGTKARYVHEVLDNMYRGYYCKADSGWFDQLENAVFVKDTVGKNNKAYAVKISNRNNYDPRCMIVVITRVGGQQIGFANLHLSYQAGNKMENLVNAIDYLLNLGIKNTVLMGDFNSQLGSDEYNYASAYFIDSFALFFGKPQHTRPSYPNGSRIDYIWLSKKWDFSSIPIMGCYTHYNYNSDHFPIILDVKMPKGLQ